jgi:mRNA-degrading endonuclease RelE of RelBE toxin-antitoxin system
VAAGSQRLTVAIQPEVADTIRHLSPDLKRGIKAALRVLSIDPTQGAPLARELEGKWRYRVRRYRIVYEVDLKARVCRVVAVGHRSNVYEDLAARLRPGSGSAQP